MAPCPYNHDGGNESRPGFWAAFYITYLFWGYELRSTIVKDMEDIVEPHQGTHFLVDDPGIAWKAMNVEVRLPSTLPYEWCFLDCSLVLITPSFQSVCLLHCLFWVAKISPIVFQNAVSFVVIVQSVFLICKAETS
jgi:hypothetical protein